MDRLHMEMQKLLPMKRPRRWDEERIILSLIGAKCVVSPGRAFMRSWIDVASSVSVLDHHVHLNVAARA